MFHKEPFPGVAFAQESESDVEVPVFPPLRAITSGGTYTVDLDWQPESPEIGQEIIYLVRFFDESNESLTSTMVTYDLEILGNDGSLIEGFYSLETEDDGVGRPIIIAFEDNGPILINVYIHSAFDLSSKNVTPIDETVTFATTVVPEFSVSAMLVVMLTMMGVIVLLNRLDFPNLSNTRT